MMKLLMIVLSGLATLAVATANAPSTPKDTPTDSVPSFINSLDRSITYHCNTAKPTIIEEQIKSGDLFQVNPIFNCLRGDCYEFNTGATCSESTINIKARAPVPQEDKHYICSKDRTSVLICRYGFCSTDRYCNLDGPGASCHDDCTCCKKGKRKPADSVKRESFDLSTSAASSPQTLEYKIAPPPVVARADSAGVPDVIRDCPKPGESKCDTRSEKIYDCDTSFKWKLAKDCRPSGCVEKPMAHCRDKDESEKSARDIEQSPANDSENSEPAKNIIPRNRCSKPGSYMCDETFQAIGICNSVYEWVLSADCRPGKCVENLSAGTAYCVAKKSTRKLAARATADTKQHCEKQGAYRCDSTGQRIAVCSPSNEWVLSSDCSSGHCIDGPNDTAYCTAKRN
ncbi:hypothetical protein J1614_004679 [Plenodomus biglobosus]|nr:hypothetical protein J1614_004679 [Plenodomus biglobosus]